MQTLSWIWVLPIHRLIGWVEYKGKRRKAGLLLADFLSAYPTMDCFSTAMIFHSAMPYSQSSVDWDPY